MNWLHLLAEAAPTVERSGEAFLGNLGLAVLLLVLGFVLFVAEIFLVSFGVLLTAAVASLIGAIVCAFQADTTLGWIFVVIIPILSLFAARWGIRKVQSSKLVPQDEIADHAGYRHRATELGIDIGTVGELVTSARPSGRARFPGGECDVQVRGSTLDKGARVVVKSIDGPIIFVQEAEAASDDPPQAHGASAAS